MGDFLILRALRESGGTALAVADEEMLRACRELGRKAGIYTCPEGGATLAAARRLRDEGFLSAGDVVLLFSTGSGFNSSGVFALR